MGNFNGIYIGGTDCVGTIHEYHRGGIYLEI